MKLKYLSIFFIVFGASSCMWGVPKKQKQAIIKDTLGYSYKIIKKRASDCGNKPDSECSVVNIKYPVFKEQQSLNDSIENQLLTLFLQRDTANKSLQKLPVNFISSYENDKKQNTNIEKYTLNIYAAVIRQDSSLTTLEIGGYAYEGGAHGADLTYFINWNSKRGAKILLSDIFVYGYKEPLTKIAEKIFRKDEKLADTATLANDYFFEKNKFSLNDNFLITPLGLRFLYNEYEIKSYAAGTTALFIPYSQIKSLLKPHTVVAQYIK